MIRSLTLTASLCLGLSACGMIGSFGTGSLGSIGSLGAPKSAEADPRAALPNLIPADLRSQEVDRRSALARITGVEATPTAGGRLLRVTAAPRNAGSYNVDLVISGRDGSTLTLDLRLQAGAAGAGPRSITAARLLTDAELLGIRTLVIRGAGGNRTLRLR